jgi:hypothetical protein
MEQFENFEKLQHNAGLGWSRENVSRRKLGKEKVREKSQEYPWIRLHGEIMTS